MGAQVPCMTLIEKLPAALDVCSFKVVTALAAPDIMDRLVTLVAPRLLGQVDRSKVTAARAQIGALKTGLDTLRLDLGRYPTESEGLTLLVNRPADGAQGTMWFGPYIDGALPLDPWGNPYQYAPAAPDQPGSSPVILSYGADGAPGGDGLNADITSNRAGAAS